MPAAMGLIAEKGETIGARYVITFVAPDNIPSLKGCQRCGFFPDLTASAGRAGLRALPPRQLHQARRRRSKTHAEVLNSKATRTMFGQRAAAMPGYRLPYASD